MNNDVTKLQINFGAFVHCVNEKPLSHLSFIAGPLLEISVELLFHRTSVITSYVDQVKYGVIKFWGPHEIRAPRAYFYMILGPPL